MTIGISTGVEITPCATVDLGSIYGQGTETALGRTEKRIWASAGGAMRLVWWVTDVLDLEAQGGLFAPLVHERFYFAPSTLAFRAPSIGAQGGLGAMIRMW
jgi:hypothetical protein